jgi:hypothetical protein
MEKIPRRPHTEDTKRKMRAAAELRRQQREIGRLVSATEPLAPEVIAALPAALALLQRKLRT